MNIWIAATIALCTGFVPCVLVVVRSDMPSALVALNLAGVLTVLILITLSLAFGRQPFIDLAVVLAPTSAVGLLVFVRFLERRG
ncbi:MAG TPA: monovalent cation/H+ antiporter complex subunit F [Solirubrobacteraceae bacterium]|jgi:multisubunit Na+/H+ antiporter MnhF subunit|nr:monovalent cation/H+ antiporter complex subunit F [Solirubrobacteraceae bacterium]